MALTFAFDANTETPADAARRRAIAEAIMGRTMSPQNVGEGFGAIASGIVANVNNARAGEAEAAGRAGASDAFSRLVSGITGGASGYTPSGGGTGAQGAGGMGAYRNAIASIESAGSGDYSAVGPTHPELGRALGRYQVMEANIGPWSKQVLGREVTPEEFMANPEIQDAIFDGIFGGYVEQFGPEGAAQAWFAGPGGVGQMDRQDSLGTTVSAYTDKFTNALGGGADGASMENLPPATLPPIGAPGTFATGPDGNLNQYDHAGNPSQIMVNGAPTQAMRRTAQGPSLEELLMTAQNPWLTDSQRGIINTMIEQELARQTPAKPDYDFMELEDGTLVRTDATSGGITPLGNFAPKPEPGFRVLTAQEASQLGLPSGTYQIGPDNKVSEIGGGGVEVNVGPNGQQFADPPFGMDYRRNPDGTVKLDANGMPQIITLPGGPQATEAAAAEDAASAAGDQSFRTANIVREDIDRIRDLVESAPWYNPAVGFGAGLGQMLEGSNATNVAALSETVKANIGFDRLQAMREASPTGGALGNVTERELTTLQAVMGNLSQSQSVEQFLYNLDRLGEVYDEILKKAAAYPNAAEFGFSAPAGPAQTPANPEVIDFTDYFNQ